MLLIHLFINSSLASQKIDVFIVAWDKTLQSSIKNRKWEAAVLGKRKKVTWRNSYMLQVSKCSNTVDNLGIFSYYKAINAIFLRMCIYAYICFKRMLCYAVVSSMWKQHYSFTCPLFMDISASFLLKTSCNLKLNSPINCTFLHEGKKTLSYIL